MENDTKSNGVDISKIFIQTINDVVLSYYKQTKLDKIVNAVENLDIDEFIATTSEVVTNSVKDVTDTFIDGWLSNIKSKLEEEKIKIQKNISFSPNEIDEKLQKLPNIEDINTESLLNYQKLLEKIINQAGLNSEKEISNFLKVYVNTVVKTSITDAAASFPLTLAQFLASIFPVGTEPLVAVNKVNEMTKQLTNNVVSGFVSAVTGTTSTGGRRKKKRKSKSKHFYINRIRQTLKQFYNY